MNVHLVTVIGGHLNVFDQMLRHYRDSGIESLLVNIQVETYDDPLYECIRAVTLRYRAEIVSVFVGKWLQSLNPYLYRHTLEQAPQDWFVLADSDEFQVYAQPIPAVLHRVDQAGYDFVEGFLIDRVAKDGGLPPVHEEVGVWQQFPLAGAVTFPMIGGNMMKVAAARGSVRLSPGQHYAQAGNGCPISRCYVPVHHFKWTDGLADRLRKRVEFYRAVGDDLWQESERVVRYFDVHSGKININDEELMLRESGIMCPHEQELKDFIAAKSCHMPRPAW